MAPGIVAGQQLGVILQREPGGERWGTRFEPFFIEEEGRVRFSTMEHMCSFTAPVKTGDFSTIEEFGRAIDACPAASAASVERKVAMASNDGWRPYCSDRESVEAGDPEGE